MFDKILPPRNKKVVEPIAPAGKKHRQHHVHKLKSAFRDRHQRAIQNITEAHKKVTGRIKEIEISGEQIRQTSLRMLSAGLVSSALFIGPGKFDVNAVAQAAKPPTPTESSDEDSSPTPTPTEAPKTPSKKQLSEQLMQVVPSKARTLTKDEEQSVARILQTELSVNAQAELSGNRLNTSYGKMGYEQHLLRYPGDSLSQHKSVQSAGIAPKRGAFGYFTPSKTALTPEVEKSEEYYFAVQTFLAPGWRDNIYQMKDWFKFRKMIAVNPKTGDVVVGVVGDAGPAVWTGKSFGGSPEAMRDLHLDKGMRNGEVILFFVDDPENKIPLGPMTLTE
ncbi:hypothetical protein HGA91_06310 [candidate division WWE3 bacterium]|nr:hypothetical protein [candidate division WWE3 bacterium]